MPSSTSRTARRWLALALCAAGPTLAQPPAPTPPHPPVAPVAMPFLAELSDLPQHIAQAMEPLRIWFDSDSAPVDQGMVDGGRVVTGAPYCADAEHETVQWLADGQGGAPNRITRTTRTRLCRDGEGRTRQEFERSGRPMVLLRDPQARESWLLDTERKSARRVSHGRSEVLDATAWTDYSSRLREWARGLAERARHNGSAAGATAPTQPTPPTPPVPPTPVVIHADPGRNGQQRHVEVEVVRLARGSDAGEAGLAPLAPLPPPAVQWRSQVGAPRGPGTVTPLAPREVEGLRAHGERTTWVIEAGKLGNERPIQITREVWNSPELMVTLQSRDFDPRSGEVAYRLKNLRRGEPDAALMRVPPDFSRPARPAPASPKAAG